MSNKNPSAMLAESVADFSKAAYQAFKELENQAREQIAHATAELRDARVELDKTMKALHVSRLESQSWKQEVAATKAALTQAELTIAHQTESSASQLETIAQLRREVSQWKDQSKNWQEHFLRVEQERCAQSSRLDELILEKLQQYVQSSTIATNTFITPRTSKYVSQISSAPSTTSKKPATPSPNQPPACRPSDLGSSADAFQNNATASDAVPDMGHSLGSSRPKSQMSQAKFSENDRDPSRKRATKKKPAAHSHSAPNDLPSSASKGQSTGIAQTQQQQQILASTSSASNPTTIRSSTVIRRVQAVVHVKREEDVKESDAVVDSPPSASAPAPTSGKTISVPRRRLVSRKGPAVFSDDEDGEEGSAEDEVYERKGASEGRSGSSIAYNLRNPSKKNYQEDNDEDEEDDELMMGAEENHDEVYGSYPVDQSRQRPRLKKKRRYSMR